MLSALKIANFKAFGETQRIPLRPLTLIYGANSSGKSSILHSLLFARHAMEEGDLDVHRTRTGGDSMDLGGFRQYVYRRDVSRRMEWAADLDTAHFQGRLAELLAPVKTVTVTVAIGIGLDDKGRPQQGALPEIHAYEILGDAQSLIRMSLRRDGNLKLDRMDHEHPVFHELIKAVVLSSTTTDSIRPEDFEGLDEAIQEMVPDIIAPPGKFLPSGLGKSKVFGASGQMGLFPVSKGRRKEDLAAAVRFFIPRAIDDLMRGLHQAVIKELSRLQYLGPLRSYPPRHLAFAQHHDPNWIAGGGYAWDVVRRDERVRELVNCFLAIPSGIQTPYELKVRRLVALDQIEEPILDGLEIIGTEGLDMEPDGDKDGPTGAFPIIKDPEAEAKNLRRLIEESEIDRVDELIMIDRRSNTTVSHRDVGIGVSQILPVLVGAYASNDQIIAIEQPEIHLHPALQADLGDVFIESALGNGGNTFLLETHSEHLLLRIMRRIRETSSGKLPAGVPLIKPEDVMVLFVEPASFQSIIHEMPLNKKGDLERPWPGGFFEEDFKELF
ncbi:MAG: AAA family ATPase [Planctomycetota bacterium]